MVPAPPTACPVPAHTIHAQQTHLVCAWVARCTQVESLQGQMRKAQEEADVLKEDLRQKEQDAQV